MTALPRLPWSIRAAHRWGTDARLRRRVGFAVALVLIALVVGLPWAAPVAEDHARERELAVAVEAAIRSEQAREEMAAAYSAMLADRMECIVIATDRGNVGRAVAALERLGQ